MGLKLGAMLVTVMVLKLHTKPTIRHCYARKFNCQLLQISFLLLVILLINSNQIKSNLSAGSEAYFIGYNCYYLVYDTVKGRQEHKFYIKYLN